MLKIPVRKIQARISPNLRKPDIRLEAATKFADFCNRLNCEFHDDLNKMFELLNIQKPQ